MTQVVVFENRLAPQVEKLIAEMVQRQIAFCTVSCSHGASPHDPSFVSIDEDGLPQGMIYKIYEASCAARNYYAPKPAAPSIADVAFEALDNKCKWGVGTTQDIKRRDAIKAQRARG